VAEPFRPAICAFRWGGTSITRCGVGLVANGARAISPPSPHAVASATPMRCFALTYFSPIIPFDPTPKSASEIFIFPAMGDDGLGVANALAFLLHRDGLTTWLSRRRRLDDVYLGRNYDGVIDECLGSTAGVKRHSGDPAGLATDLIRAGKVGAIYVGRMEYGPRALGNRSIIASPHDHPIHL